MSDETNNDESKKGKKGRPSEGVDLNEPVPKDAALFEWLESLFYSDEQSSPEKLDLCPVYGARKEKLDNPLDQRHFAPAGASEEAVKKMPGRTSGKLSREKLVELTNRWLHTMQRDCDERGMIQTYAIHAWHFKIDDQPYSRFLKTCKPSGKFARSEGRNGYGGDDDENRSLEERHSIQVLEHHQKMFNMYASSVEGMFGVLTTMVEKQNERIDKQDATIQRQNEMMERALSLEAERTERLEWARQKHKMAEKGFELGMQVLPPLLNGLTGKKVAPQADSLEAITLRNFFKLDEEGGRTTQQQLEALCGKWDGENIITAGVLTREQVSILAGIAFHGVPPEELDRVMPGAQFQITPDQLMKIQQIFSMDQLAPLFVLFESRRNKQQK